MSLASSFFPLFFRYMNEIAKKVMLVTRKKEKKRVLKVAESKGTGPLKNPKKSQLQPSGGIGCFCARAY